MRSHAFRVPSGSSQLDDLATDHNLFGKMEARVFVHAMLVINVVASTIGRALIINVTASSVGRACISQDF